VVLDATTSDNQWLSVLLSYYCGLRCEEICYLTPNSFETDYRLVISRSKLTSSRRSVPWKLLIPEEYQDCMQDIVSSRLATGSMYLLRENMQRPMPTWKLSKQIGRLLVRCNSSVRKMHGLRHGFASWNLFRYFMLVDNQFRRDVQTGRFMSDIVGRHPLFGDRSLANFSEVIGGAPWRYSFKVNGECVSCATDFIILSKLLGHANRFTTLEHYCNSLGWVVHYFLLRREAIITGE